MSTTAAANSRIAALAADRAVHRAFAWLHLHEPQIRQWQIAATAIPAPPFGEDARAVWFRERFAEAGLQGAHLDAEGNALAVLPGPSPGPDPDPNPCSRDKPEASPGSGPDPVAPPGTRAPVVLLSAHLDTVFPPGTACLPREEASRLLAPGITDNGAGLAALLALAAALQSAGVRPACAVLFAANVGEEGEGDLRGMRHLFMAGPFQGRLRAALALEGAGTATVISRALGTRRLRVTVGGPGGHSWADFGRPNPILALSSALLAVSQLPFPSQPRTTVNVGTIRGGTSVNSIPSAASADLDLRSVSGLHLDSTELAVLRTLERALAAANATGDGDGCLTLDIQRIGDRAAGELAESSPLLGSLQAVDRHLQFATESRIGSTDANLPLSLGIAALALGAGGSGGGIHTTDEWFDSAGRTLALRRILLLLLDTCQLAAEGAFRSE